MIWKLLKGAGILCLSAVMFTSTLLFGMGVASAVLEDHSWLPAVWLIAVLASAGAMIAGRMIDE